VEICKCKTVLLKNIPEFFARTWNSQEAKQKLNNYYYVIYRSEVRQLEIGIFMGQVSSARDMHT
jgi:hypothetical protein